MQIHYKPPQALFPFESRWFDGAGPRLHYIDEGKGPAVVMFHGNPTWSLDPAFGSQGVIDRWQRDFPEANLTRIADANHYIQEDAPEAIAAAVERAVQHPILGT